MWEDMGGNDKDSKFFRFCSPVNVFSSEFILYDQATNVAGGLTGNRDFVITDAVKFVDYDTESYIKESFLVMHYTKGGLTLKDIDTMPFSEFKVWIKEATRIQDMILNKQQEDSDE